MNIRRRSLVLGKEILILPLGGAEGERNFSEGISAVAIDIDQDGCLVVRYQDGSIDTLNSGGISIRTIPSTLNYYGRIMEGLQIADLPAALF